MGKYDLVGSNYDRYSKGNKYKNEVVIKVPGVNLTTLEEIDDFTAGYASFRELSQNLPSIYQTKNTISIRGNAKNGYYFYKSVIYNNEPLKEIIRSLTSATISTPTGYRSIKKITSNNQLFQDSFANLKKLIAAQRIEALNSIFGEKSDFVFLLNRYFSSAKEEDAILTEERELEENFRNYEVFRKFLTNKSKILVTNLDINSKKNLAESNFSLKKKAKGNSVYIGIISIDDEDDDYDPDEFAFYSDEEIAIMAGGEGNVPKGYRKR